ncbi:MAG: hypothetical protein PHD97_02545 [Bacteroidales bacterium]|nr:hypothetical protein [Bacteroidales bacterium]
MKKTFTLNDLILYTYNETSETDKKELTQAIKEDGFLRKQCRSFRKTKKLLDDSQISPGDNVISNILAFSKALKVVKLDNFHNVEYVMN